jgi:predicted nucleic acid-binding protein
MVACDSTFLSLLLEPSAKAPLDLKTGKPVDRIKDRIEKLIDDLQEANERLIIPTPVLSEFLVLAGKSGQQYLDAISGEQVFVIKPFDEKAAIELAAMEIAARAQGDKRGGSKQPWAKIKFDRQVVAIAKASGASCIYSDDEDVRKFGEQAGLEVVGVADLPLPPAKQMNMDLKTEPENQEG